MGILYNGDLFGFYCLGDAELEESCWGSEEYCDWEGAFLKSSETRSLFRLMGVLDGIKLVTECLMKMVES